MNHRLKLLAFVPVALSAGILLAQQNTSDTTRNPLGSDPVALVAGQQLYDQTCQGCHGPAGQGDRAPALNTPTFVHGSEDGDMFHSIRSGHSEFADAAVPQIDRHPDLAAGLLPP